ncbi:MAG TPA: 6-phosphogluconolactonase, partial [Vicinamibacterales bacterium]|nr:6-phosphogluconolactonase [Vicinamibacterales bacterium]
MRPDVMVAPVKHLLDRLAADVSVEAAHARSRRGLFAMALPGGSVGVHGFPVLATVLFDWDVTHIFWADERAVPASSPDSNFGLADSLWLRKSGASLSSIHPMHADHPDLKA